MNGNNVDTLIDFINPLIRGTANYWKPFISSEYFLKWIITFGKRHINF